MDPIACLREIRAIVNRIQAAGDSLPDGAELAPPGELRELAESLADRDYRVLLDQNDVLRLAELFEALDNWIRGGGFLPAEWGKSRDQTLVRQASESRAILRTLLDWNRQLGKWEAPVWDRAAAFVDHNPDPSEKPPKPTPTKPIEMLDGIVRANTEQLFVDLWEYLDDRQDTRDGADSQPEPNAEMSMLHALEVAAVNLGIDLGD